MALACVVVCLVMIAFPCDVLGAGVVIRGTFAAPQNEASIKLYTTQTFEKIDSLRKSGDTRGMMTTVTTFVRRKRSLTREEATSLFLVLKAVINDKRKDWQEWKLENRPDLTRFTMIDFPSISLGIIAQEVDEFSREVIGLLEKYLLPNENEPTLRCSYIALRADYLRYVAEFSNSQRYKQSMAAKAAEEYNVAEICARHTAGLPDSSEILLGILLNRSVLEYEIMGNKARARETCLRAVENVHRQPSALSRIFSKSTELSDASVCVIQTIKRNIELWNLGVSNQEVEDEWIMCDVSNVK